MNQDAGAQGWVSLIGIGVRVRYGPDQLNIVWSNDSNVVLRFDAVTIFARVEPGPVADVIQLQVNVHMDTPPGVNGIWFALLPFPERSAPAVQQLAETLNAVGPAPGDGPSNAAADQATHPSPAAPEIPVPAQSAPVRIRAWPGYWTDDRDWLGLYPTRETERLLMMPSDQPAEPTEHPQVT